MALAGIDSVIPVDEVISAMGEVSLTMPVSMKETAEGGIAATPTGKKNCGLFDELRCVLSIVVIMAEILTSIKNIEDVCLLLSFSKILSIVSNLNYLINLVCR